MRRRALLKSCLIAPFVGLFKGNKEYSCSASMSGHPSTTNSAEPSEPLTLEKLRKCKDELDTMERLQIEAAEKAANPPMIFEPPNRFYAVFDKEW